MNFFEACSNEKISDDLNWLNEPDNWSYKNGILNITVDGNTDTFRGYGRVPRDSAAFLYREVEGDFSLISRVSADTVGFGDAVAITIRKDEEHWAKLCLERSPTDELSIVSVVTNKWSDDANNEISQNKECFLRITRRGELIGMHYSLDGKIWRFARAFGIDWKGPLKVGLHGQAPYSKGIKVNFSQCEMNKETISDFRSGE